MGRKRTYDEKQTAQKNKDKLGRKQGGRCYYYEDCGIHFERDNVYPHAAHRIIDSVVNIKKYGYEILDSILNFHITCGDCNSKAIVNPETQTGKDLIEQIRSELDEKDY